MFDVLYKPSNLPALIYVVFGCLVPAFTGLHAFLIINTMLLWVIHKIFALYKNDATLGRCFDIGFLISIVSMFYFPCIILFLFYIISLSIFQPFAWRDYVLSFMGLLAPWFLVWIVLFLNDNSHLMAALFSAKNFKPVFLLQTITNKNIITIGSLSLLLIVSLYKLRSNYYKNVIKTRNCQLSFLLLLVTTGFITLIPVEHSVAKFSLLIIPVSVFVSYFFLVLKKVWLAEMVFMCLLALLIYNYF